MGGNLGGVLSPTLTPFLAEHYGWVRALDFTGLVALGAALLWLSVNPSNTCDSPERRAACGNSRRPS